MQRLFLAFSTLLGVASTVLAGMPGALPEDFDALLRLSRPAQERLQAISFFLVGIAVSAGIIKLLWNSIAKDSNWLPRLSWTKAVAVVLLWGSLFVLVLTMISGARELMTPGAWKKDGNTYTLENSP